MYISGKLQGHNITPMQYFELNTLADHPLLKAIVNKRICDVKKISNATFLEYMQDYDKLVSLLLKKLDGSDEDVIFGTIALFTLEWKYNVPSNRGTTLVINNSSQKATIYNYGGSLSIRI